MELFGTYLLIYNEKSLYPADTHPMNPLFLVPLSTVLLRKSCGTVVLCDNTYSFNILYNTIGCQDTAICNTISTADKPITSLPFMAALSELCLEGAEKEQESRHCNNKPLYYEISFKEQYDKQEVSIL